METIQILIPSIWTVIILGCILYVKNNKRFPVTFFSGSDYVKVESSPSLSWSRTSSLAVLLGFIFLAIMWAVFIVLATNIITFPEKSNGATWMVAAPTLLSLIFFFSGYSSRLVNNYVNVDRNEFGKWERDGLIEKKGEKDYVDVNGDKLLHAFDNKQWIR